MGEFDFDVVSDVSDAGPRRRPVMELKSDAASGTARTPPVRDGNQDGPAKGHPSAATKS